MRIRGQHSEHWDSSEDGKTVEFEEERLRQILLAYLANRPDTTKLNAEARQKIPIVWKKPSGTDTGKPPHFVTLPRGMSSKAAPHWLIQLDDMNGHPLIGIEVVSDIVLGVARTQVSTPDFDLSPYGAVESGISRRHAMLRPSANKLYLIDLGSTNGTRLNGALLKPNLPTIVQDADLISLAALTFSISIIATPADFDAAHHTR